MLIDVNATLSPDGEFVWTCACGTRVNFQIGVPSRVECGVLREDGRRTCTCVYVWDGAGFEVKHWYLELLDLNMDGDAPIYQRVLR